MTHDPTRGQPAQLDTEIRRAVSELVDLAPLPPGLDPEAVPSGRGPARALAVTVLLFVLVVGLAAAALAVVRTPGDKAEQPSGPPVGPTTTRPAPTPTLVGPANPPARLRLALGGTVTQSGGPDDLLLADATGSKTARLLFTAPIGRAGCTTGQQVTTTSGAGGARGGPPATQRPQPSLADARWQMTGAQWGALHWCDDNGRELDLVTKGLTERDARALALTVRASPTDPSDVAVDPPAGFVVGREFPSNRTSRLLYERTGSPSPRLEVTVQSAWTTNLQLLAATAERAELLQLSSRPAVALFLRPGKKTPDTFVVLWDDATLVTLRGEGLTDAQLRAAAADLIPVDPALAPGDPDRDACDRLGLCG